MNTNPKPHTAMPLDAVSHLNPGWHCWHQPTPTNSPYHAQRDGYPPLTATTPEDLHTKILTAESHTTHPIPQPANSLHSR